jgi:hypothetical protein
MTILIRDYLKQPSEELFLNCLNTKTYPFKIRARVINAYRKLARNGFPAQPATRGINVQNKEHPKEDTQTDLKKSKRLRTKRRATYNQNQGSPKNSKVRTALKLVVRYTSRGKGKVFKKPKEQFVVKRITIHLKGNKYSGGQREF